MNLKKNCGVRVGLGKAVVFGSAFLAGAVVFEEKHAQTEAMSLGSAFLAGAFVFRENHVQRKSYVSRVAVPSRGSCFPKHAQTKAMSLGSAFLAGALVF